LDKDGNKFWTAQRRYALFSNYQFYEMYQKIVMALSANQNQEEILKYNKVC